MEPEKPKPSLTETSRELTQHSKRLAEQSKALREALGEAMSEPSVSPRPTRAVARAAK